MNIFNKLANKQSNQTLSLRQQYLSLLASIPDADRASDKDGERLEALMGQLGVSVEQSAKDHTAIHAAIEESRIAVEGSDLRKQADALEAKRVKAIEDHRAAIKASEAKLIELNGKLLEAQRIANRAEEANQYLHRLKQTSPDVHAIASGIKDA